jgi:hypothetical protein
MSKEAYILIWVLFFRKSMFPVRIVWVFEVLGWKYEIHDFTEIFIILYININISA